MFVVRRRDMDDEIEELAEVDGRGRGCRSCRCRCRCRGRCRSRGRGRWTGGVWRGRGSLLLVRVGDGGPTRRTRRRTPSEPAIHASPMVYVVTRRLEGNSFRQYLGQTNRTIRGFLFDHFDSTVHGAHPGSIIHGHLGFILALDPFLCWFLAVHRSVLTRPQHLYKLHFPTWSHR